MQVPDTLAISGKWVMVRAAWIRLTRSSMLRAVNSPMLPISRTPSVPASDSREKCFSSAARSSFPSASNGVIEGHHAPVYFFLFSGMIHSFDRTVDEEGVSKAFG